MVSDLTSIEDDLQAIVEIGQRRLEHYAQSERRMAELVEAGTFIPPCDPACEGWISYFHENAGEPLQGVCPLRNVVPPCLIPAREEAAVTGDLGRAGWPSRYLHESVWERCDVESLLRALPANVGVLILGPVGTGKTSAAALLAKKRWPSVRTAYAYWGDLVAQMDRRLPDLAKEEALCIDDFGVGTIPDWKLGLIDYLWEYRNSRKLTTVVTSNLTLEQLTADEMSARWVDRWRQLMPHIVTVGGESKR